jgi:hypothetical protein
MTLFLCDVKLSNQNEKNQQTNYEKNRIAYDVGQFTAFVLLTLD